MTEQPIVTQAPDHAPIIMQLREGEEFFRVSFTSTHAVTLALCGLCGALTADVKGVREIHAQTHVSPAAPAPPQREEG